MIERGTVIELEGSNQKGWGAMFIMKQRAISYNFFTLNPTQRSSPVVVLSSLFYFYYYFILVLFIVKFRGGGEGSVAFASELCSGALNNWD